MKNDCSKIIGLVYVCAVNKSVVVCRKKAPENTIMRDYVLPDYTHIKRGYVKTTDETSGSEQLIRMNNERFSVPEILFRPSDVGIHQMGVAEAVSHVVSKLPKGLFLLASMLPVLQCVLNLNNSVYCMSVFYT